MSEPKLVNHTKKLAAYDLGRNAEAIGMQFMMNLGYKELHRRYKSSYGEIDIIAINETEHRLAFIEVKSRTLDKLAPKTAIFADTHPLHQGLQQQQDDHYNQLDGLISLKQQQRCLDTAQYFLAENSKYCEFIIGFDVIILSKMKIIRYIPNAWTL